MIGLLIIVCLILVIVTWLTVDVINRKNQSTVKLIVVDEPMTEPEPKPEKEPMTDENGKLLAPVRTSIK